jgi:hypothetical protein
MNVFDSGAGIVLLFAGAFFVALLIWGLVRMFSGEGGGRRFDDDQPHGSTADEIAKLHELLRQGAIDKAEFAEAKRSLLAGRAAPAPVREAEAQVVVVAPPAPRSGGGCGLLSFLLLIALGVALVVTKPDQAAIWKAMQEKHGIAVPIGVVIGEALGTVKYTYHDYLFFSTLTQRGIDGVERTIAYGVLGQVIIKLPGQ